MKETEKHSGEQQNIQGQVKRRWYTKGWFILLLVIAFFSTVGIISDSGKKNATYESNTKNESNSDEKKMGTVLKYEIIEEESFDYADVQRKTFRIVINSSDISEENLEATMKNLVDLKSGKEKDLDGISIFSFSEGDDYSGQATLGKCDWAPGGVWGNIENTTDRSDYQLKCDFY